MCGSSRTLLTQHFYIILPCFISFWYLQLYIATMYYAIVTQNWRKLDHINLPHVFNSPKLALYNCAMCIFIYWTGWQHIYAKYSQDTFLWSIHLLLLHCQPYAYTYQWELWTLNMCCVSYTSVNKPSLQPWARYIDLTAPKTWLLVKFGLQTNCSRILYTSDSRTLHKSHFYINFLG